MVYFKDLTGQKFGRLTALKYMGNSKWLCKCDCGTEKIISGKHLKDGGTKSCGCISREVKNLMGQKFGKLTPVKYVGELKWLCKCDCGNDYVVKSSDLNRGHVRSCGCLRKESSPVKKHGLYKSRIYGIWQAIKNRCYNKNHKSYKDYGERGIKVCEEWRDKENGFINFYNWAIQNGYDENVESKQCTIDRIDTNGNYEPSNCRWVSSKIQSNNKRNNINITYNNRTQTLKQWCEELDINYKMAHFKIHVLKIPAEDVLNLPISRPEVVAKAEQLLRLHEIYGGK